MGRKRYRTQLGIAHDVLEALARDGPMSPTRLSTIANLPYDRLVDILNRLEKRGCVARDEGGLYKITEKGYELLEKLRELKKIAESLGLRF